MGEGRGHGPQNIIACFTSEARLRIKEQHAGTRLRVLQMHLQQPAGASTAQMVHPHSMHVVLLDTQNQLTHLPNRCTRGAKNSPPARGCKKIGVRGRVPHASTPHLCNVDALLLLFLMWILLMLLLVCSPKSRVCSNFQPEIRA